MEPEEDDLDDSLYDDELGDDSELYGNDDSEEQPLHHYGGDHYGDSFDDDFADFNGGNMDSEPVFSSEGEAEFFHET